MVEVNLDPFKEPRGFIRVIEFVLAILAFSTAAGYTAYTTINAKCGNGSEPTSITFSASYPFNMYSSYVMHTSGICDKTPKDVSVALFNFQNSAQFYVFVGVMVFLACIGSAVVYSFFTNYYEIAGSKWPTIDLIVTGVVAVLWLIASSVLAKVATDVGRSGSVDLVAEHIPDCKQCKVDCLKDLVACTGYDVNTAGLVVSCLFGFLNCFVWAANCWFLYKETPFFSGRKPEDQEHVGGGMPQSQSQNSMGGPGPAPGVIPGVNQL